MDAERLFTQTKQGFGFYHKHFGVPYAFGKYDQLFVPEFNAGAMENAGAVTFLEDYVFRSKVTRASYERRAETVLHEMAHMWFGDLVTMRWWDDLWLNESFATFASVLCQAEATEYTQAWTTFANTEKSWAYRQDQLPSTHPVAADIPDLAAVEVNFDGITYAKGASVLKQLVAYVGLEHFLAGLRDYFRAHAFGNATFDDLLTALEKASGRDLSDWGRQWLKTTGLNTLRADFDVDADGRFTRFAVTQSGAAPGAGETRVHRLAVGVYDDDGAGRLVRVQREELDVSGASTEVPALVGVSQGKLILVNDDDLTYCSLRLDPDSLQTALDRIADIAEPLPRTLVWSAAWEMTRDAELRARDFVALVSGGVQAETEVGVAQRLLLQAQTALGSYADPEWARSEGWPAFADRLLELARGAQAGSDHQLAFVNALCSSVLSTRHVVVLADLLDHDPAELGLAGLTIDTDLRWRIVTALAAAGEIDADGLETPFIDAEVQRDPTAAGQAPRRPGLGGAAAACGQGEGVGPGHRRRHAGQHCRAVDHRRFRRARPSRGAEAVRRSLLRGDSGHMGASVQRSRPDRGRRPVPDVGHQRRRHRRGRRISGQPRAAAGATPAGARGPRRGRAVAEGPQVRWCRSRLSRRDAGAGDPDGADQAVDQVAILERRRRSGHTKGGRRLGASAADLGAVDHLDRVLVGRNGDQHRVVRRRHLGQDLAGSRRRVAAQVADVDGEPRTGGPRPVSQRVVKDDQIVDRKRVVHRHVPRFGDSRDPAAGGDHRPLRQLGQPGRCDGCDLTSCHWRHLPR